MDFLPIFLNIKGHNCIVIGGGNVAARKISLLLRAGGKVTVISPKIGRQVSNLINTKQVTYQERDYQESDFNNAYLVIAATNNSHTNETIAASVTARNIPVNVVDNSNNGNFIIPSIIDRSPIIAAVSTGGTSPVLARLIRTQLESLIPAGYSRLARLAGRFRDRVRQTFSNSNDRNRFWNDILQSAVSERVFSSHIEEANTFIEHRLASNIINNENLMGEVYLVGSGPGDPDLLTFKALRAIQQADTVVYDRLVAKPILDMARQNAERIYVGKERNIHVMRQEEINKLLTKLARDGKKVVRLKGGDPFIFGRGGEEIDTLAEENIPFQVIPGITAAVGCASYSGIPLTHRNYAQSVTFVTGHLKDNTINLNWKQLAEPNQTVVFYMGLKGLPVISRELQKHGVPSNMSAALIQQGTTYKQRVFTSTLADLPRLTEREKPTPPTLIIVGRVVELREKLSWFKPLKKL